MQWFKRKQTAVLGIDISTAAVKLLELSREGSRYKVESYSVAPLPQDAVVDKNINNVDVIGEAIRRAVKQSGTKLKTACVAVAGSSVMTKVITMPASLNDDDMAEQILVEADQYIPFALDEVNLDFVVQGANANNPELVDVLLAAARRETLEDRVEAVSIAGLKAKIVDIEAFAMENAYALVAAQLPREFANETVAIADVGATMTTLNVLHGLRTIYTREQSFGGRQLTEEVQRRYGLSQEEAGMAKRQGGLPETYEAEVLMPFKRGIVQQVARSLQFFVSSSVHHSISCVVMAGGCASIVGIEKMIEQELSIPAFVANPFINMALSNRIKPQVLSNDAPALMVACGLALRSFD